MKKQKKLKHLRGATLGVMVAGMFSASANATFINGTLGFSDGLDSLGNVVSDLTFFDIGFPTNASGGTGDFAGVSGEATTADIDLSAPEGTAVYQIAGFTFTMSSLGTPVVSPLACAGRLCGDEIAFSMSGVVSGNGFDPTAFVGNFTANGVCTAAGSTGQCAPGSRSGTWSSTVVATGEEVPDQPVPAPGTVALLGLGLLSLGAFRKRTASR